MKKALLTFVLAVSAVTLFAAPVSLEQARRVAETFWLHHLPKGCERTSADIRLVENTGFDRFYIFDIDQGKGFVIVSADDCAYPVLGYSVGRPAGEMGANVRFWLDQYEQEIDYLVEQRTQANEYIQSAWDVLRAGNWEEPQPSQAVAPMLTTTWNQSPYYNNLCPPNTPAGCSAIAMAQVMKYWNYPPVGTGSHSYSSSFGTQSANFGSTYYDWSHMPNSLSGGSSSTQVNAVATLCYHVGVSIEMEYGYDGSSAALIGGSNTYCVQNALKNFFDYRTTLQGVSKSNYTDAAWVQLLKDEMDAGRPVPYAGFDNTAGHAFVFDGYNNSNQFHINWGWGGYYDGYFTMGALNPAGGGTGTNGSNTFNIGNQAVVGVQPSGMLRLSKNSVLLPQNGTASTVTVSSNATVASAWTASCNESWVTLSPATGSGNGTLTTVSISATANNTGVDRVATVTFTQGTETATLQVAQLGCNANAMCQLSVVMTDRYGDGWEGAQLTFTSPRGTVYGTATVSSGSTATETIAVCPDTVVVSWQSGSYDNECAFTISNANGVCFFSHAEGAALQAGQLLIIPDPCATTGGIGPVTYTVTGEPDNATHGHVTGGGSNLPFGFTDTLYAWANDGYRFVKWQDNNSVTNPREIQVASNKTYRAIYANLGNDTLHYDNGKYKTALGAGSSFVWGVKFTPADLVNRPTLTSIMYYHVAAGTYTITLYQGGDNAPQEQIYQGSVAIGSQYSQTWITLNFDNPVAIDRSKTLWVTFKVPSASYPAAMADWCGNDNGSMLSTNGGSTWSPLRDHDFYGTWLMRVVIPVNGNPNGVATVNPADITLAAEGRRLFIVGAEGRMVQLFDMTGRCLHSSEAFDGTALTLPAAGVYMVRIDGSVTRRVVVY
ncbi:MAG: C10 family peptidase [Bacteroidales bacterium]|nr:C10 family peptidase [Bacteroidales bacterium]